MFYVLAAYSMYNMEVGYCQGMSVLAGLLLLYMDEEESFWGLSVLLTDKKYSMHGSYSDCASIAEKRKYCSVLNLCSWNARQDSTLTVFLS